MPGSSYESAGVRGQSEALSAVVRHLRPTFAFPVGAEVVTEFGHYASVLKLTDDLALAICTDGVGSKTIVASLLDRYDTIAYDCVAMNVNDIVCVGARPLALVDYLGVHTLDALRADEILGGLAAAAKEAGIAVPGGEVAQLPEIIGLRPGIESGFVGSDGVVPGDERAFDLVGTCVGTVHPDRIVLGQGIGVGDAIIGVASSGLHSNGYTLARRVLLKDAHLPLDQHFDALGARLGEVLLRPTEIYAQAILGLWDAGIETRGLAHITSDGFANLVRLGPSLGFELSDLIEPAPIFDLIQRLGAIDDAEMFRVFNMGVGFVVIVPDDQTSRAVALLLDAGHRAQRIGTVTSDAGRVHITERRLIGGMAGGNSFFERAG